MTQTLVIGFGISGKAAAQLLQKQGRSPLAVDRKAKQLHIEGGIPLSPEDACIPWETIDQVILSPGISLQHPLAQEANQRGLEIIGEVELALRSLSNPCIGITGSNGKTTVTLLVTHLLNHASRPARALGNVGTPLSFYALNPTPGEILVIELSSFQLETMASRSLETAICLNLTSNHLDRYSSLEEYANAKSRITQCVKPGGCTFISSAMAEEWRELFPYGIPYDHPESSLAPISSIRYTGGAQESQNCKAARALVQQLGIDYAEEAVRTFKKPPHRLEYIGEKNGVRFYNDSKATSIDAVLYAMNNLEGSVILLAGGFHKGAPYTPWKAFQHQVQRLVVFGQAGALMEEQLKGFFVTDRVPKMKDALLYAMKMAEPPVAIVLSPGCSSYDEFENYEERGTEFKRIVATFL